MHPCYVLVIEATIEQGVSCSLPPTRRSSPRKGRPNSTSDGSSVRIRAGCAHTWQADCQSTTNVQSASGERWFVPDFEATSCFTWRQNSQFGIIVFCQFIKIDSNLFYCAEKTYRPHYIDEVKNLRQQVRQQSEQLRVREERVTELTEEMKAKDEKLKLCDGFIERSSKVYYFQIFNLIFNNFFSNF